MTSDEIKEKLAIDLSTNAWLREVALLLALMYEKQMRGPGRPPERK
jgi:hypothetical protein